MIARIRTTACHRSPGCHALSLRQPAASIDVRTNPVMTFHLALGVTGRAMEMSDPRGPRPC